MIKFEEGVTYTLASNKGTTFTGVLINKWALGLDPMLKGKDGDGRRCFLPLKAINNPEHGWRVVNESND